MGWRTTTGLGLLLVACSHSVPPEVAKISVRNAAPEQRCEKLGPVQGTHSGNDRLVIMDHARNKLRAAAHELGGDYVVLEKTDERSIGLGWQGMGGVGPEITLFGQAYRCGPRPETRAQKTLRAGTSARD